jgi:hypothetical protein
MNANNNSLTSRRPGWRRLTWLCVGGLTTAGMIWLVSPEAARADINTNAPAPKVTAPPPAKPDQPPAPKHVKRISGVELYAIHCNRCHAERYPVEFNEAQWKTLMLHMRVRANLPADQAREVLKYLQDEAGY